MTVTDKIFDILNSLKISFEQIQHPPVRSCADSALHRQAAGWSGAGSKCILFHAKKRFYLVITTAENEIKARLFKTQFGTKNIRFASAEELVEHAGCAGGSIPPFGLVANDVAYFVDESILDANYFMFNPGIPTQSIRIGTDDLKQVYSVIPNPVTWYSKTLDSKLMFKKSLIEPKV